MLVCLHASSACRRVNLSTSLRVQSARHGPRRSDASACSTPAEVQRRRGWRCALRCARRGPSQQEGQPVAGSRTGRQVGRDRPGAVRTWGGASPSTRWAARLLVRSARQLDQVSSPHSPAFQVARQARGGALSRADLEADLAALVKAGRELARDVVGGAVPIPLPAARLVRARARDLGLGTDASGRALVPASASAASGCCLVRVPSPHPQRRTTAARFSSACRGTTRASSPTATSRAAAATSVAGPQGSVFAEFRPASGPAGWQALAGWLSGAGCTGSQRGVSKRDRPGCKAPTPRCASPMAVRAPSAPTRATRCKQVLACLGHAESPADVSPAGFGRLAMSHQVLAASSHAPTQALHGSTVDAVASSQKPQVFSRLRSHGLLFRTSPHLPSHVLAALRSDGGEGTRGERASVQGRSPARRGRWGVQTRVGGREGWEEDALRQASRSSRTAS
jgi:hypothetical protein